MMFLKNIIFLKKFPPSLPPYLPLPAHCGRCQNSRYLYDQTDT